MTNAPRFFVVAVHGNTKVFLKKPLPLRASALDLAVIPIAEVPPDTYWMPHNHSIPDASKIAGVSVSTIKREIDDDHIPSFKLRGRRLISNEDLVAYLSSLRSEPPSIDLAVGGSSATIPDSME